MFKDYYAFLGVSSSASGDQIRNSFRKLALQYHPDRAIAPLPPSLSSAVSNSQHNSTGDPPASGSAEVDFTELQEAYEVLSDVARRYLYDLSYNEYMEQLRFEKEEAAYRQHQLEQQILLAQEQEKARVLQQTQRREEREKDSFQEMLATQRGGAVELTQPVFAMNSHTVARPTEEERRQRHATNRAPPAPPHILPTIHRQGQSRETASAPPVSPRSDLNDSSFSMSNTNLEKSTGSHSGRAGEGRHPSREQTGSGGRRGSQSMPPPRSTRSSLARASGSNSHCTLPSLSLTKTISVSFDEMLSQAKKKKKQETTQRDNGSKNTTQYTKPQNNQHREVFNKTIQTFFARELAESGGSTS